MQRLSITKHALWTVPLIVGVMLWSLALPATASTLIISTTSLPQGQIGVAYAQTATVTGGTGAQAWAVTAGGLPAGLTLNVATGAITGTPTAAAVSNFTLTVTDADAHMASQPLTIAIATTGALAVTTASLPAAEVSGAFAQSLIATGGVVPYTWSITTGALPAGLTLNTATGLISGAATGAGTSNFTVRVTDSASNTASFALSITAQVVDPLDVTTAALPAGQVGVAYAQALSATGGVLPYTWSVSVGALPVGLTLNAAAGVLSGTPTGAGTSNITMQVTDSMGHTNTQAFTIVVNAAGTLAVTTTSMPAGQVGVAYGQALTATGGVLPYTWSVTAGTLPAGLTINATAGVISGTPTTAATSTITVQVADSASHTATQSLSIAVTPASTLAVTTASLPAGQSGIAYAQALTATGGVLPYTWSVSVGALPAGLAINTSTGVITGTPTGAGTSFTVQVADAASSTDTQALSIAVTVAGTLTVTTVAVADGQVGIAYPTQTLTATGGVAPYIWTVLSGALPAGLALNTSTGTITGTPSTVQTANFIVQVTDSAATVAIRALEVSVTTASGDNSEVKAKVMAVCAAVPNAHPQLPALCQVYSSGQLPKQAQSAIGRVILQIGEKAAVASDFTNRVNEACANDAAMNAALPGLCAIFNSGQLPPHARNGLGKIILELTGNLDRDQHIRHSHDKHDHDKKDGKDKDDNRIRFDRDDDKECEDDRLRAIALQQQQERERAESIAKIKAAQQVKSTPVAKITSTVKKVTQVHMDTKQSDDKRDNDKKETKNKRKD